MLFKRGRYSGFIRPILYTIDVSILVLFLLTYYPTISKRNYFIPSLIIGWFLTSFFTEYYNIYRFTKPIKILSLSLKQYIVFSMVFFSFFAFSSSRLSARYVLEFLLLLFSCTILLKFLVYLALKTYRLKGGNRRNTIIIGHSEATINLKEFFFRKTIYGYRFLGFFTNKENDDKLGDFNECFEFIESNNIDDIYCSISEFKQSEIEQLVKYANTHFKTLKFIPDSNQILSSGFEIDYYDYFPVLTMSEVALNQTSNRLLKRAFDILFSLFIILGFLSWLTPLLYILIKLESGGPLFYIRERNGLDYKKFKCYKFRTLKSEIDNENHVSINDHRVTKIGMFLRKTSLDELPQFLNVLKGDMSVVGPRPHMLAYNKTYADQVDNSQLMARHRILPGITGLAQVRGYRGEIEKDSDIIGRVKLDLFYIKNWSVLLDIKIIFETIINLFKGDKKAY